MTRIAAAAMALIMAIPVVSVPVTADAQVRAGRQTVLQSSRPRPLSDREYERLTQAETEVQEADERIAEIQALAEQAGGMTPEQQTELRDLQRRRDQANRIVERLSRRL